MPSQPNPAVPSRKLTTSVLLLAGMTIMANATIAPSLPGLKAHFIDVDGIDTLAGLLLSLPSLAIVLSAGLFGWLADRVDRQKLLMLAAVLYAAGGTSGLWAQSFQQMLAGRLVLGVGVAGTMTLAMAWGADLWQGEARARFLGLQGAAMSAGGIVVMLLGGALASLHWRGAFAVYGLVVPVAIFALIMLAPYSRKITAARAAQDGVRIMAVAEPFPWRAFAFVGSLAFLFMITFYVIPTRLAFFLDGMGVKNPLLVGAIMASMTLISVPGALSYGRMRRYVSPVTIFALSYVLIGLGMLILSVATGPGVVLAGVLTMGLGMGPAMPNYTTYFMAVVPASQRGRASGLLTTAFFAGQFASPLITAPLVAWRGLPGTFQVLALLLMVVAAVLIAATQWQRRAAVAAAE